MKNHCINLCFPSDSAPLETPGHCIVPDYLPYTIICVWTPTSGVKMPSENDFDKLKFLNKAKILCVISSRTCPIIQFELNWLCHQSLHTCTVKVSLKFEDKVDGKHGERLLIAESCFQVIKYHQPCVGNGTELPYQIVSVRRCENET